VISFLNISFPSVQLNTSSTYNVITLFAAVRILVTLYRDWKFDGLWLKLFLFVRQLRSMNAKYLQVMCHSACITTN